MNKYCCIIMTIIFPIVGLIVCSVLLNTNYIYDNYQCQNITITPITDTQFKYTCQYISSNQVQIFKQTCYDNHSLNCEQINRNIIKIYIKNSIVKFKLEFGLAVCIFTMIVILSILATICYRDHRNKHVNYNILSNFSMPAC